ncbi:MAG: hypothetical protein JWP57_3358 [Spirosoma sp.]|nr:hypothetical protein [Spirosoma sp.]
MGYARLKHNIEEVGYLEEFLLRLYQESISVISFAD